jgi:hypothetical protein
MQLLSSVLAVLLLTLSASQSSQQPTELHWYKGNTHAHTLNSDGDSTPDDLVRWYREQRYHFLVVTDHNFVTSIESLNALHGADGRFLVMRGEEVTDRAGEKPIHVNAINLPANRGVVAPQGGTSPADVLQRDVDAIRAAGAVPHVNHPNFGWALTAADLRALRNCRLMEIFNGHPQVNNVGGGGMPGMEAMWDVLLTNGQQMFGVATDDTHELKRPWSKDAARPGQGWVMVRAARLAPDAIVEALERGDFYASTGVQLADVQATSRSLTLVVKESGSTRSRVQFIGKGGQVLKEVTTSSAVYEFAGDEAYVRAKVIDSNGLAAWTQPVFIPAR